MTAKEFFYLQPTKSSLSMEDIFKFAEEYHEHQVKELNLTPVTEKMRMDRALETVLYANGK